MPALPVLIDDTADRCRIKAACDAVQDDLRNRRLALPRIRRGLRNRWLRQGNGFPAPPCPVEERRVIRPDPGRGAPRPRRGAPRRVRLAAPRLRSASNRPVRESSIRARSPGGSLALPPACSRSLIAAGRIVTGERFWPGDAPALECAVVGLSPSGQGSKAAALSGATASSSATAKPAAGRFSSWWKSKSSARSLARPWGSRSRESNSGRKPTKGSPLWVRSTEGNACCALRFKTARGSISSGRRRKSSSSPIDRLASRRIFPASPVRPPKSMPIRRKAGRHSEGCAWVRPGPASTGGGWRAQRQRRERGTRRGFLAGVGADRDGKRHAKAPWRDDAYRPTDPRTVHAQLTLTGGPWRHRPPAPKNYCRVSLKTGYERRRRGVPKWSRRKIADMETCGAPCRSRLRACSEKVDRLFRSEHAPSL